MIQEGIVALIQQDATLASLIAGRIYAVTMPKNDTLPCICYTDISLVTDPTLVSSGYLRKRIRFDCWAQTYSEVKHVQEALVTLLDGFAGTLPDGTTTQSLLEMQIDFYEQDSEVFRSLCEFSFTV